MIYSQNSEQTVILDYFGLRTGNFLDVGANDGKTLSNTHALALADWSGVCLEPAPEPFEKLEELYTDSKVLVYNLAISSKSGKMPFYASGSHLKNGDSGLLSTLKKSEIDRWKGTEQFDQIEVECITWPEFYKGIGEPVFDFVSIDAEGMDLEILRQMDLKKMGTELLCIEWNHNAQTKAEIKKLLPGWTLIHMNFENLIYGR